MKPYVILSDSSCDISPEILKDWGVKFVNLTFKFDNSDEMYTCQDVSIKDFYHQMRSGRVATTSAANYSTFQALFEDELKNGADILYIGFSSGLSSTVSSAQMAAKELELSHPGQRVIAIDTLAASAGEGFLLYMAVQNQKNGMSLEENAKNIIDAIPHMCHWFTVDDLVYLKRGGRISAASAFAATVLDIKPVLHMDDEGHLINMMKVRGRSQSIKTIAKKYFELAQDPQDGMYFISNGDCMDDALALEEIIYKQTGHKAEIITSVGPVIGAHSGPGTLALFFLGKHR